MPVLLLPFCSLSGDGSCDHGQPFSKRRFPQSPFFRSCWHFRHCPALSGRWQQTTLHRRNYLCFTVVSLLCHLYRRSQPVFIKNITDYQTDFLCYIIRIIGLHSPLEFLHGIANHTLSHYCGQMFCLAILPTAVSLICTALAIQSIGSTPTAILGALEPVTALFFGVLLFHEKLTPRLMVGILMIITAVTLIIIGKSLIKKMSVLLQISKK